MNDDAARGGWLVLPPARIAPGCCEAVTRAALIAGKP
jgi:hypothetical protein